VDGGVGLEIKATPTNLVQLITITFDVDMPPTVMGVMDSDRFGQIVANLLSNARHHGDMGSPIHLIL